MGDHGADGKTTEFDDAISAYLAERAKRAVGRPVQSNPEREAGRESLREAYHDLVRSFQASDDGAAGTTERGPESGRQELAAARELVIEHEAVKTVAAASGRITPRKVLVPTIGAVAAALTIYLFVARPSWVYPAPLTLPTVDSDLDSERLLIVSGLLAEEQQTDPEVAAQIAALATLPHLTQARTDSDQVSFMYDTSRGLIKIFLDSGNVFRISEER
ncbi:MAG: hypothetical protein AB7R55_17175 [Gemmatimonadales bacterium]